MDYTNKSLGLRVQTQIPLDVKTYAASEAALINLGSNANLAYTYPKGLIVYCALEGTRYEWKEMEVGDVGLRPDNFIYPNGIVTFGIDYSGKEYNFVKVEGSVTPPTVDQNNFARFITIQPEALPDTWTYTKQDVCDYVLALPSAQRTILETDSKWNIVVLRTVLLSPETLVIHRVYEIENKGKGIITTLVPDDLLQINAPSGLQEVLDIDGYAVYGRTNLIMQKTRVDFQVEEDNVNPNIHYYNRLELAYNYSGLSGEYVNLDETDSGPSGGLAINQGIVNLSQGYTTAGGTIATAVKFRQPIDGTTLWFPAKPAGNDYTIALVEDVNRPQKILTYPTDFPANNYNMIEDDYNRLLIVKNAANNVTITVPTTLAPEHYSAFIRQGTGEVAFVGSGTTINSFDGLRINGTFQSVALDREGTTSTFYLTGNTKV